MSQITTALLYTNNRSYAFRVREKCLAHGVNLQYAFYLKDFARSFFESKNTLLFVDAKFAGVKEIIFTFQKNYANYNFIVFIGEQYHKVTELEGLNTYFCNIDSLDVLLPHLFDGDNKIYRLSVNIPKEFVYEYATTCLRDLMIPSKMTGYKYILQCVSEGLRHSEGKVNLTKDVYPIVANINNTSIANVEKSIRTAINSSFKENEDAFRKFGFTEDKITNSIFLVHMIIKLRLMFLAEKNKFV